MQGMNDHAQPDMTPVYVPSQVLDGDFMVVDGFHIVPIPNGVMAPAKGLALTLASMCLTARLPEAATRNSAMRALADQLIDEAETVKQLFA
jgi:hypothetical protein